jgi:hypothetical protein
MDLNGAIDRGTEFGFIVIHRRRLLSMASHGLMNQSSDISVS